MSTFKQSYSYDRRAAEAARVRARFVDRVPVICEKSPHSSIAQIDKKKYLVPSDLNVGQFAYIIRKRLELKSDEAIFIFVNNNLPPTSALMSDVYEKNKDLDGFLYVTYSGENVFG